MDAPIENPIRSKEDIDRLTRFEPREALAHVLQAIGQIQRELAGRVPLIGFAGAPFTLASYAIEGGHSNNFGLTKALMYGHPEAWHRLCDHFSRIVGDYLVAQIEAGVDAVQIFDSWVGALSPADYREFVLPHTRRIFETIAGRVPTLHFGTGTAVLLQDLRDAGGDVIGVDWRMPIDEAWARIGPDHPWYALAEQVSRLLSDAGFSVISGGLACVALMAVLVRWHPPFTRYDAREPTL